LVAGPETRHPGCETADKPLKTKDGICRYWPSAGISGKAKAGSIMLLAWRFLAGFGELLVVGIGLATLLLATSIVL
jgi:hypothetical protein